MTAPPQRTNAAFGAMPVTARQILTMGTSARVSQLSFLECTAGYGPLERPWTGKQTAPFRPDNAFKRGAKILIDAPAETDPFIVVPLPSAASRNLPSV